MVTQIRKPARRHLYIEEHMDAHGLNDEKLGARMGVSRTTVWRWRVEQRRLDPQKIADIAAAIGIEPEDLWRIPGRPSVDAILKDRTDDEVQKAAETVKIWLKAAQ